MKRRAEIRRRKRNRAAMFCISLVVLFLLCILLWQGELLESELARYQEQEQVLTKKLEEEKARTKEIDGQKEYMQTDEYVEEAARDRLLAN